jgi:hypothetical protein
MSLLERLRRVWHNIVAIDQMSCLQRICEIDVFLSLYNDHNRLMFSVVNSIMSHPTVKTCFAAIREAQEQKQKEFDRIAAQYIEIIQRNLTMKPVVKFRHKFFDKWDHLLNEKHTLEELSYESNQPEYIGDLLTARRHAIGREILTMRYIWQCLLGMTNANDPLISCPRDPHDKELTTGSDWQKDRERGYLDETLIEQFAVSLSENHQ